MLDENAVVRSAVEIAHGHIVFNTGVGYAGLSTVRAALRLSHFFIFLHVVKHVAFGVGNDFGYVAHKALEARHRRCAKVRA